MHLEAANSSDCCYFL